MNKEGIEIMEEYRQRILDLEQQNAELREGIQHNQKRIIDLLEQLHNPEGKPTKEMRRADARKKREYEERKKLNSAHRTERKN